ncbi:MAG: 1-acyl-sn-glycerol-3-phosphate acyltransferase [Lachnospiraceae bacterium]|nr:1-acyl-sn-glycerol-3-phosphate acyltransferase [Lachnospiraceae bacterium]
MIRFILLALFVLLFLICSIPLLIAEYFIGKFNMDVKNRSSLAIVQWAFRVCLFITGVKLTVIGEENVPKDEPVLYIGNHRSYFDVVITYARVPNPTGYISKKEILRYPLLRDWMRYLHCLFLDRQDLKQGMKTILEGIEKVKSGISICIFPEGTRNKVNDTFLPFHEGSFKIAEKTGCAIIPMSLNNTADIFEDHLPRIKKTHVILEYGKPIYMSEMSREEKKGIGMKVQQIIKETYFKNKELL